MTETVAFDTLNVLFSLIVFIISTYKVIDDILRLVRHEAPKFNLVESVGLGLLGAGCLMTIGPITFKPSPYDDWSSTLFRFGVAVYFIGRITRHWLNNWLAKRDAAKWRAQR